MNRAYAWSAAAVCALSAVVSTVCLVAIGSPFSVDTLVARGYPLIPLAGLVAGTMGSLVLSRHPGHRIGRLLAFAGLVLALSVAFDSYGTWVLDAGGPGPKSLAHGSSWVASLLNTNLPLAAFVVVVLLAPDGRLRSPRWRLVVALAVLGAALVELAPLTEPATYATSSPEPQSALATGGRSWGFTLIELAFLLAFVSVLGRERRAKGVERVQVRWFSAATAGIAVSLGWLTFLRFVVPDGDIAVITLVPLAVAVAVFPVLIAIAVLRYRLYDIDVIVNRAWLLLGSSAFIGAAYVVVVILAGTSSRDFWPGALVAALVATVFQPVRVQLIRLAERLAYGDQAPPYLALADLSRRLGQSPDPDRLLELLAEACSHATGAAAARADLLRNDGTSIRVTAPTGALLQVDEAVVQEVRHGGVLLGRLSVQPHPGRALRRRDLLVLTSLGEQAGIAFRNLRLDDDLRRHVRDLDDAARRLEAIGLDLRRARADELAHLHEALAHRVVPLLDAACQNISTLMAFRPVESVNSSRSPAPLHAGHPAWSVIAADLVAAQAELRTLSHGLRTPAP